ncbi:competence protein ComJ [Paenibacillus sp. BR2-3]|uniref:competence protein ComJ n=1 Tax=Paenibacillus sp. BR2-3 TaxID=3048494 RepID=UPI0039779255
MDKQPVTQEINLAISDHQIQVRSRDFNEDFCQWGNINIAQGAIIHPGYITFDPIEEEAFGAVVKLSLSDQFQEDDLAERRMVVPFDVLEPDKLELLSVAKGFRIELPLEKGRYALYFEICEDQEVYYKLTFVRTEEWVVARFLLEDEWGGEAEQPLVEGYR